jgi:DNA (cytosine-5)-methyltransferase 1
MASAIAAIKLSNSEPDLLPWNTVRDALRGLPQIRRSGSCRYPKNHDLNPGARAYKGHCGSLLDEPAKTLKAGSHGVPGGENSLVTSSNRIRYFSIRECARFQTFPDDYSFVGSWIRMMRQLGNAVPVRLAELIARSIRMHLEHQQTMIRDGAFNVTNINGTIGARQAS